jgi:hypothetical protein
MMDQVVQTPETEGRDTVQKIQGVWMMLRDTFNDLRNQQIRSYNYVIGDQISKELRKKLTEAKRPALVYNLLIPLIVYIAGMLAQNKTRMKAVPVRMGDEESAGLHTVLVSDYAIGDEGYFEISKAALDAAIAKVGFVNQYWSTRKNPEGSWICEAFDPLMVMWDPDGRRSDQEDWRYLTVSAMYTAEEIIQVYEKYLTPEQRKKILDEAERIEGYPRKQLKPLGWWKRLWTSAQQFLGKERHLDMGLTNDFVDSRNGIYRVIEFHDKRMVTRSYAYSPLTRASEEIPSESRMDEGAKLATLNKVGPDGGPAFPMGQILDKTNTEMWMTVVVPWLMPDMPIFEIPYPIQNRGFQLKPIFCYDFHVDRIKTASIIDSLLDPQDSYNQRRMSMLEWIMDAVHPDYMVPADSIAPENEAAWTSKDRGVLKKYTPVGNMRPEKENPLPQGAQLEVFAAEDRDIVQMTSGITPNLQGFKETNRETGVLFAQRVQAGIVMLGYFMGQIERAMKGIFNYADSGMQKFLTLPRAIRLLDESSGDPYWLQLNMPTILGVMNDVSQGEYDFKPDQTQIGATAKQMKFVEAMEFVKTVPPQLVDWTQLFDLWDSPVSKKMKQFAQQMMGQMVQQQQIEAAANLAGSVQTSLGVPDARKLAAQRTPDNGKGGQ